MLIQKKLVLLFLVVSINSYAGLLPYKYSGLKGAIYSSDNTKFNIEVISRKELKLPSDFPNDLRDFFETMWITRFGREAVIHLLKSKSKILIEIKDSLGAYTYLNDINYCYANTSPLTNNGKCRLIKEYDGKQTWEAMRITIYKGSYYFGLGDYSLLEQGKIIIMDYSNQIGEIKGKVRDSLINVLKLKRIKKDSLNSLSTSIVYERSALSKRVDPKNQSYRYRSFREFYYLTGVHEIGHTTTKNIALSRKNLDTETPAYKLELKARNRLKKVLKNKKLHYE